MKPTIIILIFLTLLSCARSERVDSETQNTEERSLIQLATGSSPGPGASLCKDAVPALQGKLYEVGPGKPYAEVYQVPFNSLLPGDEVRIHGRPEPYKAKIGMHVSGTAEKPIVIRGFRARGAFLPVIDGNGARENADANHASSSYVPNGLIVLTPSKTGQRPGHIIFADFTIMNAHPNASQGFIDSKGVQGWWWNPSSNFAFYGPHDISIVRVTSEKGGNGLFAKNVMWPPMDTERLTVRCSQFVNNGVSGSDRQHNAYTEVLDLTVEHSYFGKVASGSAGNNFKDRSAGLVFRYNIVNGAIRQMDLVDAEDSPGIASAANYGKDLVYGNVLVDEEFSGLHVLVHYGTETGYDSRKHLSFFNNTVVFRNNQKNGGEWYKGVFKPEWESKVDAYNNLFASLSPDPNGWAGDFYMSFGDGPVNLGNNWSVPIKSNASPLTGLANVKIGSNPLFADFLNYNFALQVSSPAKGIAGNPLPGAGIARLFYEPFFNPLGWQTRPGRTSVGAVE